MIVEANFKSARDAKLNIPVMWTQVKNVAMHGFEVWASIDRGSMISSQKEHGQVFM
jgi:hypothetical protein